MSYIQIPPATAGTVTPDGWVAECQAFAQSLAPYFKSIPGPQMVTDFNTDSGNARLDWGGAVNFVIVAGGNGVIGLGVTAATETAFTLGTSGASNAPIRSMRNPWCVFSRADAQVLTPTSGNRQALVGIASSSGQCYLGYAPELSTTVFSIWTESAGSVTANLGTSTATSQAKFAFTSTCRSDWCLCYDGFTIRAFAKLWGQASWTQIGELLNVTGLAEAPASPQVAVKSNAGSEYFIYDKLLGFTAALN
jgi:hypothetical protein